MALNPPQLADGTPTRLQGQYFVLNRKGIEFEVKIPDYGKKTGKGWLVLSTARIVLVNQKKSDLHAFDIPLAYLYKEKFSQPIFGANYYSGVTKPLFDMIKGDVPFKIWFMKGGCGKFLRAIKSVLGQIRENRNRAPSSGFVERCNSGAFMQEMSYVDPNDPSVFYFEQPPVAMPVGGGGAPSSVPSGAPPSVAGAPPGVVGAPPSVKIGGSSDGAPPPPSVVGGGAPPIVISGKKEESSLYPSPEVHYEPTPAPAGAPGASPYVPPPSFYSPPSGGYGAPPPSYPPPGPSSGYKPEAAPGGYAPSGGAYGEGHVATGAGAPPAPAAYPGAGHLPPQEPEQRRGQYYGFFGRDLE